MSMTHRARIAGACLVGFAAAFFANMILTDVPDIGATTATADFYAVTAHRTQAVVAFYVLIAAVACLIGVPAALLTPRRCLKP